MSCTALRFIKAGTTVRQELLTFQRGLWVAADDVLSDFLTWQNATLLPILGPRHAGRVLHAAIAALSEDGVPAQNPRDYAIATHWNAELRQALGLQLSLRTLKVFDPNIPTCLLSTHIAGT